jgi:hypothetical protein
MEEQNARKDLFGNDISSHRCCGFTILDPDRLKSLR